MQSVQWGSPCNYVSPFLDVTARVPRPVAPDPAPAPSLWERVWGVVPAKLQQDLNGVSTVNESSIKIIIQSLRWIQAKPSRLHSAFAHTLKPKLSLYQAQLGKQLILWDINHPEEPLLVTFGQLVTMTGSDNVLPDVKKMAAEYPSKLIDTELQELIRKVRGGQYQFLKTLRHIIRLIEAVLCVKDVNKPVFGPWEAAQILGTLFQMISFPLTLFAWFDRRFEHFWRAACFTGASVMSVLGAAYIYYRWFDTCPDEIFYCLNLVDEAKRGKLQGPVGRDQEIQKVIDCLAQGTKVLFTGPSGVGKTEIVNGIALRIAKGEVPENLKNKKIFKVNTARLVGAAFEDPLSLIKAMVHGHDDAIIFFDEIQAAFKENHRKVAEELKSGLDDFFPVCLAATTDTEYKGLKSDGFALFDRFEEVSQLKEYSEDELVLILQKRAFREGLEAQFDEAVVCQVVKGVMQKENKAGCSCLRKVLAVWRKVIRHATIYEEKQDLVDARKALEQVREKNQSHLGTNFFNPESTQDKQAQLTKLQNQYEQEKWEHGQLTRNFQLEYLWKDRVCRLVYRLKDKTALSTEEKRDFLFSKWVFELLETHRKELLGKNIGPIVTKDLVDKVLKQG